MKTEHPCPSHREQLLDRLRADHAHARHPQQREYLATRISTIYTLLKTLRHDPNQN